MAAEKSPRTKPRPKGRGAKRGFLVVCAVIGALSILSVVSCKSSKDTGKDARQGYEKSKEALKEGLEKTGELAKKGLEKGGEAAKEGLEKTKDAAKDFSKGWQEGGKK
jgi:hypothetical protein